MPYYNANVYRESPTIFYHDSCLPDDQYETVIIAGRWVQSATRRQVKPWHWSPVWTLDPDKAPTCKGCGGPVTARDDGRR